MYCTFTGFVYGTVRYWNSSFSWIYIQKSTLPDYIMIKTLFQVRVQCLEQCKNLLEYNLKYFPTISTIVTLYMSEGKELWSLPVIYVLSYTRFWSFFRKFQFEQPMIYMLYPSTVEMIRYIITKFIKKRHIVLEDDSSKKAKDIFIDSLRLEVSSVSFVLVLITFKECTVNL